MKRIKKGDEVVITTGKDKSKTGTVERVDGDRVVVAGANMVTKHVKPNPMSGEEGGRIQKEMPIHVSNVSLLEEGKAVRVGFRVEDGKKVRFSKRTEKVI